MQIKVLLIFVVIGVTVSHPQRGHYAGGGSILGTRYQGQDNQAAAPAQSNLVQPSQGVVPDNRVDGSQFTGTGGQQQGGVGGQQQGGFGGQQQGGFGGQQQGGFGGQPGFGQQGFGPGFGGFGGQQGGFGFGPFGGSYGR